MEDSQGACAKHHQEEASNSSANAAISDDVSIGIRPLRAGDPSEDLQRAEGRVRGHDAEDGRRPEARDGADAGIWPARVSGDEEAPTLSAENSGGQRNGWHHDERVCRDGVGQTGISGAQGLSHRSARG